MRLQIKSVLLFIVFGLCLLSLESCTLLKGCDCPGLEVSITIHNTDKDS